MADNTAVVTQEAAGKITMTIPEAAKRSGIGINELYWHAKNNPDFPAFTVGKSKKKIVVYIDGFDKWVAELAKKRKGFDH